MDARSQALRQAGLGLVNQLENLRGLGLQAAVALPVQDAHVMREALDRAFAWAEHVDVEPVGLGVLYQAASNGALESYWFVGYARLMVGAGHPEITWQAKLKARGQGSWERRGPHAAVPEGERYIAAQTEMETVHHATGGSSYWSRKMTVTLYYRPGDGGEDG